MMVRYKGFIIDPIFHEGFRKPTGTWEANISKDDLYTSVSGYGDTKAKAIKDAKKKINRGEVE